MFNIIHMVWIPIAYKIAPFKIGQKALRGNLLKIGVDPIGIPLQASLAISEHVYRINKLESALRKKSYINEIAGFSEGIQLAAIQIKALFYEKDRSSPFLYDALRIMKILESFDVKVPPLTGDNPWSID